MPNQTATVTGHTAIFTADILGLRVSKYADPIEDARVGLDYADARAVAAEDPSLIYFHVSIADGDIADRIRKLRSGAELDGDEGKMALCDDALAGASGSASSASNEARRQVRECAVVGVARASVASRGSLDRGFMPSRTRVAAKGRTQKW